MAERKSHDLDVAGSSPVPGTRYVMWSYVLKDIDKERFITMHNGNNYIISYKLSRDGLESGPSPVS